MDLQIQKIKFLKDAELVNNLESLVKNEKILVTQILEYLHEVEQRKLFLKMGYGSLFDFCTKKLNYCAGSAQIRISALRMLQAVPAAKESIKEGRLQLSVVAKAQSYVRQENLRRNDLNLKPLTVMEKTNLLFELENLSSRDSDKKLTELFPQLNEGKTLIQFYASHDLLNKLEELKKLLSHKCPDQSWQGLFSTLADMELNRIESAKKRIIKPKSATVKQGAKSRYVPSFIKQEVWKRDHGCCTYVENNTGTKCNSKYQLQVDHIHEYSKGGTHEAKNLRLLCAQHNRLRNCN